MKRAAWLLVAALVYIAAAWTVAPGFYDGFQPPSPYCFVSPPPNVQNCSDHARAGQLTLHETNGTVDPGSAFTGDGQAELSVRPGAFNLPSGHSSVTIKLSPTTQFPTPTGLKFLTNVYLITADAPLNSEGGLITLRYSADLPAPSFIYQTAQGATTWSSLGKSAGSLPCSAAVSIARFCCIGWRPKRQGELRR